MTPRLPSIAAVRQLTQTRGLEGAVIISFTHDGKFSCASYGSTKEQCRDLAKLADFIVWAIEHDDVRLPSFDTGGPPPPFADNRSEYT